MSWAKLDDAMLDNDKIVAVGTLGFALHVAGILHCSRNLTDGFVPTGRVATLLDFTGLRTTAHAVLERLLTCKPAPLWRRDDERDGYEINDYLKYNPSKAQALAKRDAARKRQGRHRDGSPEVQDESRRDGSIGHAVTGGEHPRDFAPDSLPPVPVPPLSDSKNESESVRARVTWGHSPFGCEIPPLPSEPSVLVTPEVLEQARANGCTDALKCLRHWHAKRWSKRGDRRTWRTDHLSDFMAWLCEHERYGGACERKGVGAGSTPPAGETSDTIMAAIGGAR